MRLFLLPLILLCSIFAGAAETFRLRARERELRVFLDALASLKSAVSYTSGSLSELIRLSGENRFLSGISGETDLPGGWKDAAERFFTFCSDRMLAQSFIEGFGYTDLAGQLRYIEMFEGKAKAAHTAAAKDAAEKGKLCTALGLFSGAAAVLVLL